jgi:hypothetical protein
MLEIDYVNSIRCFKNKIYGVLKIANLSLLNQFSPIMPLPEGYSEGPQTLEVELEYYRNLIVNPPPTSDDLTKDWPVLECVTDIE